jgi:hypothetical protein
MENLDTYALAGIFLFFVGAAIGQLLECWGRTDQDGHPDGHPDGRHQDGL